jgi:hypothetical protein
VLQEEEIACGKVVGLNEHDLFEGFKKDPCVG